MGNLSGMVTLWKIGAFVLFAMAIALIGGGVAVAAALTIGAEILGLNTEKVLFWTIFTSPAWGPLPVGYVLRALPRDMLREAWLA